MFLHVFEIGEENDRQPEQVELIPPAGVQIGKRWRIQFNAIGPLGGKVDEQDLATTVHTESQYSAGNR